MRQVNVTLSTYTSDVSGVCSALYELGGMVVIHDPSGCNSTYNTHDEPRWYEQDSLVFISGLSQMDAILGNDEKFITDIVRAAGDLSPKFIALVRTPIPLMTGTDFAALAHIVEGRTGIPTFYFPTSGMRSYVSGAGMALSQVARSLVREISPSSACAGEKYAGDKGIADKCDGDKDREKRKPRINLLGATPLDFSVNTTLASLREFLSKNFNIISVFAMGSPLNEIARAGEADANLVISSTGFPAAQVLCERFGTPYVVGMPMESFADEITNALFSTVRERHSQVAYRMERTFSQEAVSEASILEEEAKGLYIIGEAVTAQSLRAAIWNRFGVWAQTICPLETDAAYTAGDVLLLSSEEEIRAVLKNAKTVIADPIYQTVCAPDTRFIPLPHEAFSGRIYRREIPDFLHLFSELDEKEKSREKK